MTLLAIGGGLLGVLFMVPLRRFLIDREHGRLPYPEGTACAEVLVASEIGGRQAALEGVPGRTRGRGEVARTMRHLGPRGLQLGMLRRWSHRQSRR